MDKTITCKDCQQDFTLTESEQQFFEQMGYQEPKRCKPCRVQRKQQKSQLQPEPEQSPAPSSPQWTDGRSDRRPNRRGGKRRPTDTDDWY